jgi:hypothetical protein
MSITKPERAAVRNRASKAVQKLESARHPCNVVLPQHSISTRVLNHFSRNARLIQDIRKDRSLGPFPTQTSSYAGMAILPNIHTPVTTPRSSPRTFFSVCAGKAHQTTHLAESGTYGGKETNSLEPGPPQALHRHHLRCTTDEPLSAFPVHHSRFRNPTPWTHPVLSRRLEISNLREHFMYTTAICTYNDAAMPCTNSNFVLTNMIRITM